MNTLRQITPLLLALVVLLSCASASADWELDNTRSAINFISVKNDSVGEVHSFESLVGYIGSTGNAELTIDLGSVQTLIDIRNERMREMLFETVKFPTASVSAQMDPEIIEAAAEGGIVTADLPVTLSLHGHTRTLTVPIVMMGEGDGRLRVISAHPVLVNAADFGLEDGVAALQKVAGLEAISRVVPVSLQLAFVPGK
jgi:polyisoprenoid-binding protein YceI